jgi:hypothetical protein
VLFVGVSAIAFAGEEDYDDSLLATDAFREAWVAQDWEGMFFALQPSESSANSHPADLMILAGMYLDDDFPRSGTKRERALKFWALTQRAALTGYEPAVIELANAFRWNDEVLGYESDTKTADCLDEIIDKPAYVSSDKNWLDKTMVKNCLLLKSAQTSDVGGNSGISQ